MGDVYRYNMPIRRKLTQDYIVAEAQKILREGGARRILFLGDSQLWGWNTADINGNVVRQIEALLAAAPGRKRRTLCANGGLPGRTAAQIADIHARSWAPLAADLCVINLRNNDIDSFMDTGRPDAEEFGRELARIAEANRRAGTTTVMVVEPMQKTFPESGDSYAAFREQIFIQAGARNCAVWDLDAYLAGLGDSGFMWEDSIHLTPYATGLAARFLAERLAQAGS